MTEQPLDRSTRACPSRGVHAWKRAALERLDRLTDSSELHPRDQVTDLAAMLADVVEIRLRVERAVGQALDSLEVKQGRPVADEPRSHTSTSSARAELGLGRVELHRLEWVGRLDARAFARAVRYVRKQALRGATLRTLFERDAKQ